LPQPHVERLDIGQQTELGRKRRELVVGDLKEQRDAWSDHDPIFDNRTMSLSSVIMCAISLGSEQRLLF
jgi:hypothetical protein